MRRIKSWEAKIPTEKSEENLGWDKAFGETRSHEIDDDINERTRRHLPL
jgi:hypothetical protein